MKVKELIKMLQEFNPESIVKLQTELDWEYEIDSVNEYKSEVVIASEIYSQ